MNMIKIAALTATLLAGASTATLASNPYDVMSGISSLSAIQEASSATVLKVNENEAHSLAFNNDPAAVKARVQNNKWLMETIERQGYTLEQIVGVSGEENSLTLYAL